MIDDGFLLHFNNKYNKRKKRMARTKTVYINDSQRAREGETQTEPDVEYLVNGEVENGPRSGAVAVDWVYWLRKYFYTEGDEVLVRVGRTWMDGRVVRIEQTRPPSEGNQDPIDWTYVVVRVGSENVVTHTMTLPWSQVVVRNGSKLLDLLTPSEEMKSVLRKFCELSVNADQAEKDLLISYITRWLVRNRLDDRERFQLAHIFQHRHWTDGLLYVILQCSIDAGDPFGISIPNRHNRLTLSVFYHGVKEYINDILPAAAMNEDYQIGLRTLEDYILED